MSDRRDLIGMRLGTYEVQGLLGSGGMARVYRGRDLNLQRPVAIKVLLDQSPDLVARFLQEARLIAQLRHPHIVQVYNFGEQDGLSYMVQELLPGPTLEQRLTQLAAQGQRLGQAEVLAIIAQMADALDAVHAVGIIHRDVKPSNMMWNSLGVLVLTDFGIAKDLSGTSRHTQTGVVMGTPNYLSPEQAQGITPLTRATDIYSLGVVLYELLAGRPPFGGDTPMQVVLAHIQATPPPIGTVRPDLPPALDAVLRRALAKEPSARFASVGELARALERAWASGVAPAAPPDRYNQPTAIWDTAPQRQPAPPPRYPQTQPNDPQNQPTQPSYPPAHPTTRPARPNYDPPQRSGGWLRLMVVLVLLLALLGGGALALRGLNDLVAGFRPPTIELPLPSEPPLVEQPTIAPEPSLVPEPPPVPTPEPVIEPTPEPSLMPEPPNPMEILEELLQTGLDSGQIDPDLNDLLELARAVRIGIENDNTFDASSRLSELLARVQESEDNGQIPTDYAEQLRFVIDTLAVTHNLELTPPDSTDNGDDD